MWGVPQDPTCTVVDVLLIRILWQLHRICIRTHGHGGITLVFCISLMGLKGLIHRTKDFDGKPGHEKGKQLEESNYSLHVIQLARSQGLIEPSRQ